VSIKTPGTVEIEANSVELKPTEETTEQAETEAQADETADAGETADETTTGTKPRRSAKKA
jgi:hypothetical protein